MNGPFTDGQAVEQAIRAFRQKADFPADADLRGVWMMHRVVTRIAADPQGVWALKGAQALLARLPDQARLTSAVCALRTRHR